MPPDELVRLIDKASESNITVAILTQVSIISQCSIPHVLPLSVYIYKEHKGMTTREFLVSWCRKCSEIVDMQWNYQRK